MQDVAAANAHMWELLEAEAAEKERVARDDARRAKKKMKRAAAAAARAQEEDEREEEEGAAVRGLALAEEAADPGPGSGLHPAAVRQDAAAPGQAGEAGAAGQGEDAVRAGLPSIAGTYASAAPEAQCNGSLRAAQQPNQAPGAAEPAALGALANGAAARVSEAKQRRQTGARAGASAAAPPARADARAAAEAAAEAAPRSVNAGPACVSAAAQPHIGSNETLDPGAARGDIGTADDPASGPSGAAVNAVDIAARGSEQDAAAGAPLGSKIYAGSSDKAVPASWEHADEAADAPSLATGSPRGSAAGIAGVPAGGGGKARLAPAAAAGARALARVSPGPGPAWGGAAAAASAAAAAAAAAARGARGGQPAPSLTLKPQGGNPKPQGAHAPVTPVQTPPRSVGRAPVEGTTLDPWAGPAALPPRALSPRNPKPKPAPQPAQPAPLSVLAPAAAEPRARLPGAQAAPSGNSSRTSSSEPRGPGLQAGGAASPAGQLRPALPQVPNHVGVVDSASVPAGLVPDGRQAGQLSSSGSAASVDNAGGAARARSSAWSDDSAPGSPGAGAARLVPDQAPAQCAREPAPDLVLRERASLELGRASSGAWGSAASITGSRLGSGIGYGAGPGTGPDRSTPASGATPLALSRSSQSSPPPDPWGLGMVGEALGIEALGIAALDAVRGPLRAVPTWEAAAAWGDPGSGLPPGPGVGAGQLNPAAKPWRAPAEPRACNAGASAGTGTLPSPFASAAELPPALGSSIGGSIWGSAGLGLGLPALSGGSPFQLGAPGAAAAAAAWGSAAVSVHGSLPLPGFTHNPAGSSLGGTLVAEDDRPSCVAAVVQHLLAEEAPGLGAGFEGPAGFRVNGGGAGAAALAPQLGASSLGSSRGSCDGAAWDADAGFGTVHGGGLGAAMNGGGFMHVSSLGAMRAPGVEAPAFYGNGSAYGQRPSAVEGKPGAWQEGVRGEVGLVAGFAAQRAAGAFAAVPPLPPAWPPAAAPGSSFGSQGSGLGLGGAAQYMPAAPYSNFHGVAGREAGLPLFGGGGAGGLAPQLWPAARQPMPGLAARHNGIPGVQNALFAVGASPWSAFPVRE